MICILVRDDVIQHKLIQFIVQDVDGMNEMCGVYMHERKYGKVRFTT